MKAPRFWQSGSIASALLAPAANLYRAGAWADRRFTTPRHAPVPVISVGNVTAGGAGKTPTTLALVPMLQRLGHTPHILTRGYRSRARGTHLVHDGDDWHDVGDEALLLCSAAPTWVGRDRFASAQAAANAGASIVVCDDALQHHALKKDLSLLVIDGAYGLGNSKLLPAGPLRESLTSALKRSHALVMVGDDMHGVAAFISIPVFQAYLEPEGDMDFLRKGQWLAFAGIARPEKFFTSARLAGADIAMTRAFADHHAYSEADIAKLVAEAQNLGLRLLTTRKDAVKIPPHMRATIAVLPVTLRFTDPTVVIDFLASRLNLPRVP